VQFCPVNALAETGAHVDTVRKLVPTLSALVQKRATQRAYVEFRTPDDDGAQAIVTLLFSYRSSEDLSGSRLQRDIVLKARHLCRRAFLAK